MLIGRGYMMKAQNLVLTQYYMGNLLQADYDGTVPLNASSVWTNFALTFTNGSCYDASLNSYGASGPAGVGLIPNLTANETVTGVTLAPTVYPAVASAGK